MSWSEIWRRVQWMRLYWGPSREVTVNTFNGLVTFPSHQWLPGKDLYIKRSYEEQPIRDAITLLRKEGYLAAATPGRTVLNVGANIGMTCIALVKQGYFERALAFEPAPDNYQFLVRNIDQNGLHRRIQPFAWALSSVNAELELELSEDNPGDHRIRRIETAGFFQEEKRRTISVPAKTLDHLWAEDPYLRQERVDLVWVDVQGHEGYFLEGARNFLRQGVPVVSEFWPYGIERSGTSQEEFCRLLSGIFASFYVVGDLEGGRFPIHQCKQLFDRYRGPREFGLIVLIPQAHPRDRLGSPPPL